jgi:hypothetical protein
MNGADMGNSLRQTVPVRCSCGEERSADIFLIVDPTEDDCIAQAVKNGTLNLVDCPRCKRSTRAAYPVLLLQESEIPPIVMAIPVSMDQREVTPIFESLLGLWATQTRPDDAKLNSTAFRLHPLIVPFEHLSRFTDNVGKRPRAVAWKAAFTSLCGTPNISKDAFAELAAKVLTLWTPDDPPVELAFLKGRLGTAVDDLDKSINYLSEALAVLKPDEFPQWGIWKYDLGCHYAERAAGERQNNVELAITCFEDALGHLSPTEDALTWAMCSSNLSVLYGERLFGDRAENCERALHHVQNTYRVFTPQFYPENFARSHIVAGQALRDRLLGDKYENIDKSIEHYKLFPVSTCETN